MIKVYLNIVRRIGQTISEVLLKTSDIADFNVRPILRLYPHIHVSYNQICLVYLREAPKRLLAKWSIVIMKMQIIYWPIQWCRVQANDNESSGQNFWSSYRQYLEDFYLNKAYLYGPILACLFLLIPGVIYLFIKPNKSDLINLILNTYDVAIKAKLKWESSQEVQLQRNVTHRRIEGTG